MKNHVKLFLATAIMMIIAIQVQSQNSTPADKKQNQQKDTTVMQRGTFVDKNNNGICDNFEARSNNRRGANFVDKNGNGVCDNFEARSNNRHGANFVDKNGDGICDHRATVGKNQPNSPGNGQGNQYRRGQCRGHGNCCRR